jgi:gamma-glutamylcyclotransferase (GGCT)/AIG2-like uncharacterized protein YtfP
VLLNASIVKSSDWNEAMNGALFTYGTLQFPEVMEALIGRMLPWEEAEAPGFAQFQFTDRIYPGMVSMKNATTQGRVYTTLSGWAWEILDRFEDPIYRRDSVEVCRSDGSTLMAYAYVLPLAQQHLLSSEVWRMDWFVEAHLEGYVGRCRVFYEALTSESSTASLLRQSASQLTKSTQLGSGRGKASFPKSP